MGTFSLYAELDLPQQFEYPEAFARIAAEQQAAPPPWLFIDANSKYGALLSSIVTQAGLSLVPFASLETGDGDVACFDGSDSSRNPRVLMLILDGSGRAYSFENFDDWLSKAENESKSWAL
jgi:hypothetical protein